MSKVLVGIRYWESIEPRVHDAALKIAVRARARLEKMHARPADYASNCLVRMLLADPECTHLLQIDNDTELPLDALDNLLALDAPVASGCYRIILNDRIYWAVLNRDERDKYKLMPEADLPKGPFDADATGAGCLLVKREVFDRIGWPWFKWEEFEDGSQTSEDIFFCKKINAAGLRVRVHPGVVCVHHKTIGI